MSFRASKYGDIVVLRFSGNITFEDRSRALSHLVASDTLDHEIVLDYSTASLDLDEQDQRAFGAALSRALLETKSDKSIHIFASPHNRAQFERTVEVTTKAGAKRLRLYESKDELPTNVKTALENA